MESAASTFSSLFGVGRNAKRSIPPMSESEPPRKSLFSLLSESKPQVSQVSQVQHVQHVSQMDNNYGSLGGDGSGYNENYNYTYNSAENDELMMIEEKYDGDNNNLLNSRLGAALPILPPYEKSSSLDYSPYR